MSHKPPLRKSLLDGIRKVIKNDVLVLSVLAVAIGSLAGGAVVLFRELIVSIQWVFFGSTSERLFAHAETLPAWLIVLIPTFGGLLVGFIIQKVMPDKRPEGVADVIEANALSGGNMTLRQGLGAALVSATSIGAGASVGREGPAVHLGATIGSYAAQKMHLSRKMTRTLLGCGVAAAVASSFNAPIAGALFASEVIIGHYALSAFAPVVIASVSATAVSRLYFGDFPAFVIPPSHLTSLWEFPAFIGLGVVAALSVWVFIVATGFCQKSAQALPVPVWLKPAIGGLLVGLLALLFPQVLGIGYGATEAALNGAFPLMLLLGIFAAKIIATALSIGFGFGGGVFSPSLVIGAMLGGAYGIVATAVFPDLSSGPEAYTLVGMGAVAAATLGAPISTVLIIFELTNNYALTMAVMIAVMIATVLLQQFFKPSFFVWQLERRGIDLKGQFEQTLLQNLSVGDLMNDKILTVKPSDPLKEIRLLLRSFNDHKLYMVDEDQHLLGTITLNDLGPLVFDTQQDETTYAQDVANTNPPMLTPDDHLAFAEELMDQSGSQIIPVVQDGESKLLLGAVEQRDVLNAHTSALVRVHDEEHGHR